MFFKMCDKLGLKVQAPFGEIAPTEHTVSAREVELLLSSCKVAWGCGNENNFSLIHGEHVQPDGFELKGLVLSVEPTNNETTRSLVKDIAEWAKQSDAPPYVKDMIARLAAKNVL